MLKHYRPYLQYIAPQHLLSQFAGLLANSRIPWFKRYLINRFIKNYRIDLSEALIEDPNQFDCFNQFFIRQLKPACRPIIATPRSIASPVDGSIAQIGAIKKNQLLQAKDFYFDLETLLGGDSALASTFYDGNFATLYLAPHNYHRVHMPLEGQLKKTIYVPGKLFSVNRMTSTIIPQLYSRNERLITLFNTAAGPMAVILVGAMIVGSIKTTIDITTQPTLAKGSELGYFKLGSTVILLFSKNHVHWQPQCLPDTAIQVGQLLAEYL